MIRARLCTNFESYRQALYCRRAREVRAVVLAIRGEDPYAHWLDTVFGNFKRLTGSNVLRFTLHAPMLSRVFMRVGDLRLRSYSPGQLPEWASASYAVDMHAPGHSMRYSIPAELR